LMDCQMPVIDGYHSRMIALSASGSTTDLSFR
jgi:hypothetical protein